jgi:hypothetical protein
MKAVIESEHLRHRIRRRDRRNWDVERFEPGGKSKPSSRGVKKKTKPNWVTVAHMPTLEWACKRLIQEEMEDAMGEDPAQTKHLLLALSEGVMEMERRMEGWRRELASSQSPVSRAREPYLSE